MRTLVEACPDTPVEFPGGKKPAWKQRSSPVPSPPEASPKRSRLLTRGWRFCGAGGRELLEPVESRAWVALVHLVLRDERHPMGLGLFPRGALEPVRTGRDWCTSGCWLLSPATWLTYRFKDRTDMPNSLAACPWLISLPRRRGKMVAKASLNPGLSSSLGRPVFIMPVAPESRWGNSL